jgi:large subunit ribosomal protein L25
MRKEITVPTEPRTLRGKNEARRLRASGKIPAIVYGSRKDAVAVSVSPKEMQRILHSKTGHNTIFNVALDGETTPAMIVDWQYDPIKDTLLHVDLKRIDLTQRLEVHVPIATHGEPKGVKQEGGLLEIVTREVLVECLPDEIPEHFTLDVVELMLGQSLRASDVPLTGSMKLLTPPDTVVVHVVTIRGVVEAVAEAATPEAAAPDAGAAEPEVIKKGKKEEEAAEETKGKKK